LVLVRVVGKRQVENGGPVDPRPTIPAGHKGGLILTTPQHDYALGIYTTLVSGFDFGYCSFNGHVINNDSNSGPAYKINLAAFPELQWQSGSHSYTSFLIVGTFQTVKDKMVSLSSRY
jgi:hypothetical protein